MKVICDLDVLNLVLVLHINMFFFQSLHPSDISSILTVVLCLERADHL